MVNTPSTGTPVMPQHDRLSDVDSLSSENTNSSVTPDMQKLNLGKRRGQPRKELVKPTMDDFPFGASEEEQCRYICKKNTEKWHYNKLVGSDAASYRQAEINHVNSYNRKKKSKQVDAEQSESSQDTDVEHQKKLSRER